jgi:glucose-6-phosphate isomerase
LLLVGHYWLRDAALAPNDELHADVEETKERILKFASDVHVGRVAGPSGWPFEHVLPIGAERLRPRATIYCRCPQVEP